MSEKERIITGNDARYLVKISRICREVSIKDICEECERTSLYPEENCGCPTTVVICEDAPQEAESSSKTRLPEEGV